MSNFSLFPILLAHTLDIPEQNKHQKLRSMQPSSHHSITLTSHFP